AVQEFVNELEAGARPDRQEFLRRYPDLALTLAQCLDGLELVHRAAIREKPGQSGPGVSGTPAVDSISANPLGDFQIIREIGRGGMGVVYEARQLSLGRRVALKVLPFASAVDPKHLQRFKNEAQAAAQLHHPGIVQVFAVGCERGVHYYAMEYIEGQSLASLIEELRSLTPAQRNGASTPRKLASSDAAIVDLTTFPRAAATTVRWQDRGQFFRWVAQVGMKAAQALEHAHQLAVVHRDIKPANLLLDVDGQVWLTDFALPLFPNHAAL